jgi:hypothetical protein
MLDRGKNAFKLSEQYNVMEKGFCDYLTDGFGQRAKSEVTVVSGGKGRPTSNSYWRCSAGIRCSDPRDQPLR